MLTGISRTLSALVSTCICLVAGLTCGTTTYASAYSEAAVKAAYIYRFTAYVDWPDDNRLSNFVVTVLDDDAVADNLTILLASRLIKNLPPQVRKIKRINEAGDAQILYIGPSFKGNLHRAISTLGTHPTLIVTSQPDALAAGSTINFLEMDNRIRFEASITSAEQLGIRISPELLSVAVRVSSNHLRRESNCQITRTPDRMSTRCDE